MSDPGEQRDGPWYRTADWRHVSARVMKASWWIGAMTSWNATVTSLFHPTGTTLLPFQKFGIGRHNHCSD